MIGKSKKCLDLLASLAVSGALCAVIAQTDPGPRGGPKGAGGPLPGLTTAEKALFDAGQQSFQNIASVRGTLPQTEAGLGPRFNMDSCGGCHAQPAVGGSSPTDNPQIAVATKEGATNLVPPFLSLHGPVRVARFKRDAQGRADGGVHALFTIKGRSDAAGCNIAQPDFAAAMATQNAIFRIPTPVFGSGLIEAIPDSAILANRDANRDRKRALGIEGRENRNGNDGTITRFGWKAQNKSLVIFSGEAYNVEQGVTNELFPDERDQTAGCQFNATPEDDTKPDGVGPDVHSDTVLFAAFMRFLAPPVPAPGNPPPVNNGRAVFNNIGCTMCHTPALMTGNHSSAALNNKPVPLFSDLLLHNMGRGLADEIGQGSAAGQDFRTAPLWGLGQRLFFLHDGRASELVGAIMQHAGSGSEANIVINNFTTLPANQKQDLLAFLRSL